MRKFLLVLLFLVLLVIFPFPVLSQLKEWEDPNNWQNAPRVETTQYLPHFVAGSLQASEWESKIFLVNLSGSPNSITVDFFDNSGSPLVVSTNKGAANSFTVLLPKPVSDSVSSDVLEIFRNTGSFVTGWVKVRSTQPFSVDLEFRQFLPGSAKPVGKADVASSPVENVLTYPLEPNNGVALVNPGSQNANVSFTAFDRAGNKIKEGAFTLTRGKHMAVFFNQEPFFLDATGIIVIASNIPLSSIALDFDDVVFRTIPRIPTPRRLDSQRSAAKIGFVYIYSNDRQPQPGVQERIAEYVGFQQALLDKEMLLYGFNRVQLPYDFDEKGLPKVAVINAGDREQYFDYTKRSHERIRLKKLSDEIERWTPPDWYKWVVFVDMWLDREVDGQRDDIVQLGGGRESWLSAQNLPFLKKSYFGDKRPYQKVSIPEFGGKPTPNLVCGFTLEDYADCAIHTVNHENGHTFWSLSHSDAGIKSSFRSMMGGWPSFYQNPSEVGCMNPKRSIECILLPIEAQRIANGMISRPNDFGWISGWDEEFDSLPTIEVLSTELTGSKLRVTFKAEDLIGGINSFSIYIGSSIPYVYFWRQISHLDNMENITAEADIFGSNPTSGTFLAVQNNQGRSWVAKIF